MNSNASYQTLKQAIHFDENELDLLLSIKFYFFSVVVGFPSLCGLFHHMDDMKKWLMISPFLIILMASLNSYFLTKGYLKTKKLSTVDIYYFLGILACVENGLLWWISGGRE